MCHLLLVLLWEVVGGPVQSAEATVLQTTAEVFQLQTPTPAGILQQLSAPVRHGGFGLTQTSEIEGRAAFLSGAAAAQLVMQTSPTAFRPFDGAHSALMRQQWTMRHAEFQADCKRPAESAALRTEDIAKLLPQSQRLIARAVAER
jgi:hypothetical protein